MRNKSPDPYKAQIASPMIQINNSLEIKDGSSLPDTPPRKQKYASVGQFRSIPRIRKSILIANEDNKEKQRFDKDLH